MHEIKFSSTEEFYEFVDLLSDHLNEIGFSAAGQALHAILHKYSWTTASEVFGQIKATLLRLKAEEDHRLPPCLRDDVNICIKTIEDTWNRADK